MDLESEILEVIFTNEENDLYNLSQKNVILLVFLRHFGCTFCREALDDIQKIKDKLKASNIKLLFVHMADNKLAEKYFEQYNLAGVEHISDPDMSLYEYFGLTAGTFRQLYGLKVWLRGFKVLNYGVQLKASTSKLKQMPGVFMLEKGRITNSFVHRYTAHRPDYLDIIKTSLKE